MAKLFRKTNPNFKKSRLSILVLVVILAGLLAGCSESFGPFSPVEPTPTAANAGTSAGTNTGGNPTAEPTPTFAPTAPYMEYQTPTPIVPKSASSGAAGLVLNQLYTSPAQPGHTGYIYSTVYSPDGKVIASAGADRSIRVWDASTGQQLAVLKSHSAEVSSLAFSPDGKLLASGDVIRFIKLWDMATYKEIATLTDVPSGITKLVFSPDGQTLAAGSYDQNIRLWRQDGGGNFSLSTILKGHTKGVSSVAFSPDGKLLASGSNDQTIKIWNLGNFSVIKTFTNSGENAEVNSVAFSPDGKLLVSGSRAFHIKGWNPDPTASNQPLFTVAEVREGVALSPDGKLLAGIGLDYKSVLVWEVNGLNSPKLVKKFDTGTLMGTQVVFSPDGLHLSVQGDGYSLVTWDVATGGETLQIKGNPTVTQALAVSPDGKTIATGNGDKTLRLLDSTTGKQLNSLTGHDITADYRAIASVAFAPDGISLASAGLDGTVRLWDVAKSEQLAKLDADSTWFGWATINMVAYSPNGRWLASASNDGTLKIWGAASHNEIKVVRGVEMKDDNTYYASFSALAFSPDSQNLATLGGVSVNAASPQLQLWNVPDGTKKKDLGDYYCQPPLLFTPDGKAAGCLNNENALRLWDINSGKPVATFAGYTVGIVAAAFSPDGKLLVSASVDGIIRLWETATGAELYKTDPALTNGTVAVAFGPDSRKFFSAQVGGSVQAWQIQQKT